jgi:hypothetical protein
MPLPGFTGHYSLGPQRQLYSRRSAANWPGKGIIPQIGGTVYHMCCPSGDCDSTFCPNNDGAHVDCDPRTGKANTSCNNPLPGCFLSSACIAARGLPDDCEELRRLRWFRDAHLKGTSGGIELINEYYRIAPGICRAIAQRSDSKAIYNHLYDELVQRTLLLIRELKFEVACHHYLRVTCELKEQMGC